MTLITLISTDQKEEKYYRGITRMNADLKRVAKTAQNHQPQRTQKNAKVFTKHPDLSPPVAPFICVSNDFRFDWLWN
jgi:hypothetical protein